MGGVASRREPVRRTDTARPHKSPAHRRPRFVALSHRRPFAGGLESHVWHLCRLLTRRGHHVTLIARGGSDPSVASRLIELDEGWAPSAAARRDVSMPDEDALVEHHAYLDALARLDDMQIDVVHNHAYHYLPFTLGGRGDIPWVSTLLTPPPPWIESALAARRHGAMRFTTVSAFAAAGWGRLPARPTVVANGIDPALWPAGPGGDRLVWTGRLTPEKAPHLAIAAARRVGMPPRPRLPCCRPGLRRRGRPSAPWLGCDVRRASPTGRAGRTRRRQRGCARHPRLGRAVRPGRRGGAHVRDAGRRVAPGWPPGRPGGAGRRPSRGPHRGRVRRGRAREGHRLSRGGDRAGRRRRSRGRAGRRQATPRGSPASSRSRAAPGCCTSRGPTGWTNGSRRAPRHADGAERAGGPLARRPGHRPRRGGGGRRARAARRHPAGPPAGPVVAARGARPVGAGGARRRGRDRRRARPLRVRGRPDRRPPGLRQRPAAARPRSRRHRPRSAQPARRGRLRLRAAARRARAGRG